MRFAFAATFALIASVLYADSVPVTNPSFESATLPLSAGNGPFSQVVPGSGIFATGGTVDGWSVFTSSDAASAAGAFDPDLSATNWTSKWWDGNNVAYLQTNQPGNDVDLFQILGPLANNTKYTLTVDVGRRGFTPVFNYVIGLGPDSGGGLNLASNLSLASNTFGTDSVTFTTGPHAASSGKDLEIVLAIIGGDGFTEAFFDNVRVSAESTAVPEPGTLGLLLAGCLAAGIGRFVSAIRHTTRV